MRPPCNSTIRLQITSPIPVARICSAVQAVEDAKALFSIFRLKADAIVAYGDGAFAIVVVGRYVDFRRSVGSSILQCVSNTNAKSKPDPMIHEPRGLLCHLHGYRG